MPRMGYHISQSEERKRVALTQRKNNKPLEARENACGQIVISVTLNLIGLEDGVGVLNQSQSEVKQTKNNPRLLSIFNLELLN